MPCDCDGIEAKAWTGDDERPDDARALALEKEEIRERDAHDLYTAAKEFVEKYGNAAMLRCISEALK